MQPVHVHGGSVLLDKLARARLPGARLEWSEVLCDGPTPAGLDPDAWYDLRAAYLAQSFAPDAKDEVRERLVAQDRALAAMAVSAEIVLWFGPELFCQALLMRLAAWLHGRTVTASLVGPGDLPGRPGCSVGQMIDVELKAAFAARVPLDAAATGLAARAWAAYTAPDAAAVEALLARDDFTPLPYLADALRRHLAELPAASDGLAQSERLIVSAHAAGSPEPFATVAAAEARPWLTDTLYAGIVRRLASGPAPLLTITADGRVPRAAITPRGRDVLAGSDRWLTPARWVGGVKLP